LSGNPTYHPVVTTPNTIRQVKDSILIRGADYDQVLRSREANAETPFK